MTRYKFRAEVVYEIEVEDDNLENASDHAYDIVRDGNVEPTSIGIYPVGSDD